MTGHARLAPSSAERWVHCAAAPLLESLAPDDESEASREGTIAHWHLTERLAGRSGEGPEVTDEMRELAEDLIADITARTSGIGLHIEERVDATEIHPTDCWGTPDIWAITLADGILLWDYKFGRRYVGAFRNWQLLCYLQGIVERHKDLPLTTKFRAVIYQPRNYHKDGPFRMWEGTLSDVAHGVSILQRAAEAASHPAPVATTGEHCRDCKGRLRCDAFLQSSMNAIDTSERSPPLEMTTTAKSWMMRAVRDAAARIKALEGALEAQILSDIRSGQSVPGWMVEQGYGRERWTQPVEDVLALGSVYGVDIAKPQEPITPAQARKKGVDPEVVDQFSEKPKGELKLVIADTTEVAKRFA